MFHHHALPLVIFLLIFTTACNRKSAPYAHLPSSDHKSSATYTTETYLNKRSDWIAADRMRSTYAGQILDSSEQILDKKLKKLQQEMIAAYKEKNFFPPARSFYLSKSHIENTELFHILKKMPKGGLLHLHPPAAGKADWVIEKALSLPECHVYWQNADKGYIPGQLHFFQKGTAPPGFFPAYQLQQQFPHFRDSLRNLLTFDPHIGRDSVDIWMEFEQIFQRIFGFTSYQPVFKAYYTHALETLSADGIQHVELREHYGFPLYDLNHPPAYFNADTVIRYYREIEAALRQKDPSFTLKTIYTDIRFKNKDEIAGVVVDAFKLRKKYPDMVKGFDLVAEEDAGNRTLFYLDTWLNMDSLSTVYDVDMPLYFHGGESDWASVDNLYDCILLGSKRIGHGFNLFKFPGLLTAAKERDICLEINPLSNQILGYISDLRIHPATYYLSLGIHITLSSDDPFIFDYEGLTYDFWSAFMAWELNLQALKQLAMDSLIYSSLSKEEKEKAIRVWKLRWNKFVEYANRELDE